VLHLDELLGSSPGIVALRDTVSRLLQRPGAHRLPPILILGETGTGKGLLARAIHRSGPRQGGPFVDVNCAAIPEHLIEAELFGYEKGAFTDARQAKLGLFQAAGGGTLFLDEVGLLPDRAQAKVLKAIEDRSVRRLGRTQPEQVDVSIITATNSDLAHEVARGRFRADLYHRIGVVVLTLPPLRERGQDIALLAEHFLARSCQEYGWPTRRLSADARAALGAQRWSGNVRELANVIESTALLSDGAEITASMLALQPTEPPDTARSAADRGADVPLALNRAVEAVEREHIVQALEDTGGNLSQAAARLSVARNTLRHRMRRLGIPGLGRSAAQPLEPLVQEPLVRAVTAPTVSSAAAVPGDRAGRRRVVAAIRAQLRGPRETVSIALRSGLLGTLVGRLQDFGARVEDIGLEGCVAFFGLAPIEDAPRRAAYAAMAARQALARQSTPGEEPILYAAIHVAPATLFRVDDEWQLDPLSTEEFLQSLRRLIEGALAGDIVVDDSSRRYLDRHFALTPVSTAGSSVAHLRLTGVTKTTYELWGRSARFVGREAELARLGQLADEAAVGRGNAVGLRGEPGGGKSRLLAELARQMSGAPIRWLETSCEPYGARSPFLTAIVLLRKCLELDAEAPVRAIVTKVRERATGLYAEEELETAIISLLANLPELHPFMMLPAPRRRSLAVNAAARLLLAPAEKEPVVLVVEDLQWIDPESHDVLDAMVEALAGTRVLLIATYRTDYRRTWRGAGLTEIHLGPLSHQSADEMLDDLLGTNPSLTRARAEIAAKTGGNPFYLEESVRALVDSGLLTGSRGAFSMGPPMTALVVVPETVREVVATRMDQLTARRRRILQCAAAIGQSGPFPVLVGACDLPSTTVREEMSALRDSAFFSSTSADADEMWEFRHALTQEAAYGSLQDLERKLLHAIVLKSMERFWAGSETAHAEVLADQAVRGEVWERAVDYLRTVSSRAYSRGALAQAIECLETALELVGRLPASVEAAQRAIDVRLDLHPALLTVGRVREIAELHPEAERLARQIDDDVRLAQVLRHRSQFSWLGGRYRVGSNYARQALAILESRPNAPTRLQIMYCLGTNLHALGDYRGAQECFASILEGPDKDLVGRVLSLTVPVETPAWCWRGFCLALLGAGAEGNEATGRGVGLAEASGYDQSKVIAWTLEALVATYCGRPAQRVRSMEQAIVLCEKIGFVAWLPAAYSTYGLMLTRLNRIAENSLFHLEQGVVTNEAMGIRVYQAQRLGWWAEALWRVGMLAEARRRIDTAVELAVEMEERGVEAETLMIRALIANSEGAIAEAHHDLTRAVAVSRALEARVFEAQAVLLLGGILRAEPGSQSQASEHQEHGLALCRAMGVDPWWREGIQPQP
jgi:DNA-binding NtrC family response regulator/tetratricopeptide (TPR) repeat protein